LIEVAPLLKNSWQEAEISRNKTVAPAKAGAQCVDSSGFRLSPEWRTWF